jgi:glycosyltransferase involved in cell wall biosynthesis
MKLSIVIPAFNEEKLLAGCLRCVSEAASACGLTGYEVVVCDNNSTDATARIAQEAGTKVVFEPVNRISLSRNTGAAAASGDWLLFIDADSYLSAATLRAMLAAVASGRWVGGGAVIDFDQKPWWGRLMVGLWAALSRVFRWAAGSFVFCRADAFRAVGGFPPDLAAAEEVGLSRKLKRWGKSRGLGFIILADTTHVSSGRKFTLYSPGEFLGVLLKMAMSPRRCLKDTALHKQFYDGRR